MKQSVRQALFVRFTSKHHQGFIGAASSGLSEGVVGNTFNAFVRNELFPKFVDKYQLKYGNQVDDNASPLFILNVESGDDVKMTPLLSIVPMFDLQKIQNGIIEKSKLNKPLSIDFMNENSNNLANRGISKSSALFKACSVKNRKAEQVTVLDATTGLGKDTNILSQLGFNLISCERHPLMSLMLRSSISRAKEEGYCKNILHLFTETDSRLLTSESFKETALPDVIYIDPMFTHTGTALPKYDLQVLRQIMTLIDFEEIHNPDFTVIDSANYEKSMVEWALNLHPGIKRVVLKRPKKSPTIMEDKIVHSYSDGPKGDIRYDLYIS
ncbi:predicted protein [Naegleria gruberi]|uniref:Predicted protein n=1 Tax=Naegleria gruberi TaxID=5762 RepID=D2V9D7_NAEGR|nr:uncharacterized protein NAEGRDRAFT_65404 [Naegleria gruberi]EFC46441.1 predicted protein [Naegleria gruberi]|eukprot:XP_002679185.1 predicted protein [Naegleria gruberi strain NEG-M]